MNTVVNNGPFLASRRQSDLTRLHILTTSNKKMIRFKNHWTLKLVLIGKLVTKIRCVLINTWRTSMPKTPGTRELLLLIPILKQESMLMKMILMIYRKIMMTIPKILMILLTLTWKHSKVMLPPTINGLLLPLLILKLLRPVSTTQRNLLLLTITNSLTAWLPKRNSMLDLMHNLPAWEKPLKIMLPHKKPGKLLLVPITQLTRLNSNQILLVLQLIPKILPPWRRSTKNSNLEFWLSKQTSSNSNQETTDLEKKHFLALRLKYNNYV